MTIMSIRDIVKNLLRGAKGGFWFQGHSYGGLALKLPDAGDTC